jgi:hypothetical protein
MLFPRLIFLMPVLILQLLLPLTLLSFMVFLRLSYLLYFRAVPVSLVSAAVIIADVVPGAE